MVKSFIRFIMIKLKKTKYIFIYTAINYLWVFIYFYLLLCVDLNWILVSIFVSICSDITRGSFFPLPLIFAGVSLVANHTLLQHVFLSSLYGSMSVYTYMCR